MLLLGPSGAQPAQDDPVLAPPPPPPQVTAEAVVGQISDILAAGADSDDPRAYL